MLWNYLGTIIVATHDKNLAQIANKIYEVKDGKIN